MCLYFLRLLLWSFLTCCRHGDSKLHVHVFVPSGSDESDCTPGILCMCVCVCQGQSVCVRLSVYHSGNGGPPAIAFILITVFYVKRSECLCVVIHVFFPLHAVSHH